MKQCRILTVINDLNRCNGITSFVMNYYKELDKSKILMDFVVTSNDIDKEYKSIIEKSNGKIYINEFKNSTLIKNELIIKKIMRENADKYDIIHSHLINKGYFYLKYAKKYGIKNRILHSHNPVLGKGNIFRKTINEIFKFLTLKNTNHYFACSKQAGDFLFGNKDYITITNALDTKKYIYDENKRNNLRKKLNLENSIVMVQVGRLDEEKNPCFSIKLVSELKNELNNIKLLFVGTGTMLEEIKKYVKENQLEEYVSFLGIRNDINEIYMASDMLVFPSKFAGLGLVAVEAQISGLKCYISENVPMQTKIIDTSTYLKLDIDIWKKEILKTYNKNIRGDFSREAIKHGYDIKNQAKILEKIYANLIKQ